MTTIRLEGDLLRAIDEERRRSGRTRASVVREAVLRWLEDRRTADAASRDRAGYDSHPVGKSEFSAVLGAQRGPK